MDAARLVDDLAVEVVADVGGDAETDTLEGIAREKVGERAQEEHQHHEDGDEVDHPRGSDAEAPLERGIAAVQLPRQVESRLPSGQRITRARLAGAAARRAAPAARSHPAR